MELQEIYKKFRGIVEELNEKEKIKIERVNFDWYDLPMEDRDILTQIDIDTSKRG